MFEDMSHYLIWRSRKQLD